VLEWVVLSIEQSSLFEAEKIPDSQSFLKSFLTGGMYLSTRENLLDISDELLTLIREAINNGFGQVEKEDNDVLPALITTSAIIAFPGQNLSEIFPVIQKQLESGSLKQGALVYNGYLTLEGKRTRAMFAEGYEQGTSKVWRFAQVYRPAVKARLLKKGQPPERLGNLKYLSGGAELRIT
jgi:hypothetical protein